MFIDKEFTTKKELIQIIQPSTNVANFQDMSCQISKPNFVVFFIRVFEFLDIKPKRNNLWNTQMSNKSIIIKL